MKANDKSIAGEQEILAPASPLIRTNCNRFKARILLSAPDT